MDKGLAIQRRTIPIASGQVNKRFLVNNGRMGGGFPFKLKAALLFLSEGKWLLKIRVRLRKLTGI